MKIIRTDGSHPDFLSLIKALDADLWQRYPDTMQNYTAGNIVDTTVSVVLLYDGNKPFGCGCLRPYEENKVVELKRMFVVQSHRGNGHSKTIVKELVGWAKEFKYEKILLETGVRQPEAIALYKSCGFSVCEKYGEYIEDPDSVCFVMEL